MPCFDPVSDSKELIVILLLAQVLALLTLCMTFTVLELLRIAVMLVSHPSKSAIRSGEDRIDFKGALASKFDLTIR